MRLPPSAAPDVRESLRELWAELDRLTGPFTYDFRGRALSNVGSASAPTDAATLDDVRQLIAAIEHPEAGGGDTSGTLPTILYGTHDERLGQSAGTVGDAAVFWETDRAALYQRQDVDGSATWVLVMCRPLRTAEGKPSDLGEQDAGFTWFDQVEGVTYRWSGGAWNYYLGNLYATFAERPAEGLADRGFLFFATDHGCQCWRKQTSGWGLLEGVGGPARGALGSLPTLGTKDAGYRYHATDFDRAYRWTGSAWQDAAGQPARYQIAFFTTDPGTGWALCNGGSATASTTSGGTASFTTPNLTSDQRFVRAGTSAGTTGGSATTHTHQVDPASATSGAPSATTAVQSGAGTTVATGTHTHDTDVVETATGVPSGASGDDALPPYWTGLPYIRL